MKLMFSSIYVLLGRYLWAFEGLHSIKTIPNSGTLYKNM